MQKWEYSYLFYINEEIRGGGYKRYFLHKVSEGETNNKFDLPFIKKWGWMVKPLEFVDVLNRVGKDGWEVIFTEPPDFVRYGRQHIILKRPIEE